MRNRSFNSILVAVLSVLILLSDGLAEAYLSTDYSYYTAPGQFVIGPGVLPDYLTTPNWAFSPPLTKFIDPLPNLCDPKTAVDHCVGGKRIPIAVPDKVTYPGSDYYEIELQQYTEVMHSELPATTLRGYVQTNPGTNTTSCNVPVALPLVSGDCTVADNTITPGGIHFLGPIIIATKGRPVRVLFKNKINPGGGDGDLFLPVDDTVMGAGPYKINFDPAAKYDPLVTPVPPTFSPSKEGFFSTNRATLHLHGGRSPWISDGTPHQWIAPATDQDPNYPQGVSVENVPDMPAPGVGEQTFFWTNQQSSRMMFYHDHAWGITRLNVYAGEAAGYLITDDVEQGLVGSGIIPSDMIPLVIMDKTFVNADPLSPTYIGLTDPTWNWGPGTAAPADQGVVTFINVTNGGSGYTAVPTVDITEPGKTGATAKAALSTVVSAVAIVDPVGTPANKGLGYVSPIVIIDPPLSGIGATADATIDGTGAITGIVVTNGGSGYDPGTPPLVTIFDLNNDNYTPAVATATVVSTVSSISVLSGGSGYVNPTVTITPAGGDTTGGGAQASATVTDIKPLQTGDLWWPHVYMPAQNPYDVSGIAPMGRWAYGPYFYPATNNPFQPIPNPYYSPLCDPADDATPGSFGGFCQAPEIPSTPNPSWGAEAFMDTPLVNGTAYPYVDVDPKAYRLRILNAAHDRFMALSLFTAVDKTGYTNPTPAPFDFTGAATDLTEVAMIDASASGLAADGTCPGTWPADGRAGGVPACSTKGPDWIMIGNEGGFLPMPVVIPPQPITWNMNPSMFNVGNVNGGSLILGPAERADVIVDFSAYRGKTLILYNDGSAPWPALNPQYDFYTGNPDGTASGSAPSTAPGKGPNTRTIMQFRVADIAPAATYDTAPLITAFTSTYVPGPTPSGTKGVFQQAQDPIIVAQGNMNPTGDPVLYEAFLGSQDYSAYNKAYNKTFPATYPNWGIVPKINDKIISFKTLTDSNGTVAPTTQSIAMKNKSIHDEMGATFDDYGRMRAALGLEKSGGGGLQVNFVVQTYSSPATENLTANGVQVWKITHNGVDTHPIHFHLFDVQVLNRIGWDGFVRLPDPTELGWKETVRISPLEDTIVAIKPIAPTLPFGVPSSFRPLNPATEIGSTTEITQIDPVTGNAYATPLTNSWANFKWEYVWHCHILSHEENDMMRAMSLHVVEAVPAAPTWGSAVIVAGPPYHVDLTWNDKSATEYLFRLDRSVDGGAFTKLVDVPANTTTYSDLTATNLHIYRYTVTAVGAQGSATSGIITASPPPPGASTLTSPVAGATIATTTPSYTWTVGASEGATQYRLYIARQGAGVIPGGDQTFNAAAICTGTTAVDTCTVNTPPMPTLTNNTTYTWNVQGSNVGGAGLWAGARLFTVTTATVPGVPTLTSPVAGAVIASTTPSYTWTVGASAGATQYRIYLTQSGGGVIPGGDQTFNAAAICTGTTAGDTCTVNTPPMPTLTNNTTYSWNVRGINAAGNGAWAGSRSFTVTTATVPGVPTPTSPIGGIIVGSTTPSYTWTVGASAGATQYRIYLTRQGAGGVPGGDRTFNAAAICTGTTAVDTCTVNTPPMPTLTGNTTYFWNLRGINAAGSGAWAGAQQFKTP